MPSLIHEALVELFRVSPTLALDLWRNTDEVDLPGPIVVEDFRDDRSGVGG